MNIPDIYSNNYWGDIDLGDDFRKPFKSNVKSLFISGSMDSNTPASNAAEIKKGFTNSVHIVMKYGGHEDMLPNNGVHKAIIGFYKGDNLNSIEILLKTPKFEPIIAK